MKRLTIIPYLLIALSVKAQSDFPFPWNPDADSDGWVSTEDLLSLLSVFDTQFDPEQWETDSLNAAVVLDGTHGYFACQNQCHQIEGHWRMADLDAIGRHFDLVNGHSDYFWVNSNSILEFTASAPWGVWGYHLYGSTGQLGTFNSTAFAQEKKCMCYIKADAGISANASQNSNQLVDSLLSWNSSLSSSLDSTILRLDSLETLNSCLPQGSLSLDSVVCVDYGVGYQCSPQGGFCPDVTTDINSDDSGLPYYVLNETCYTQFDVSICIRPNWRKFRAYGKDLSTVTHVLLSGNYSTAPDGTGDYRVNQIIKSTEIFNSTNESFDFYIATNPPFEGASYLRIEEYNWNTNSPYNDFGKFLTLSLAGTDFIFETERIFRFQEW